ncbi:MAG: NTP transferase domain-containing protein [Kiritimatiellae bacterium]|nr:NTP transferase domain-containing protein [Kiritimatiellia bacterium]
MKHAQALSDRVALTADAVVNPGAAALFGGLHSAAPVLVLLAAGKGTRFGTSPKCVQQVRGIPLARHSINAFRRVHGAPCITVVGYAHEEVMAKLGEDNLYVKTANPTGGTAWAAFEALCVPGLVENNPLLVLSMGDRIIPEAVFRRLLALHVADGQEADLTLLSAFYAPPAQHGKGRIIRDPQGRIIRILEQCDIDTLSDPVERQRLDALTEANCPLYAVRARTLLRSLGGLRNGNAQQQYYFTDLVETLQQEGGVVRALTTRASDPEYILLCSDVTRPPDLARLESILATSNVDGADAASSVQAAAEAIAANRSPGQTASIAAQLRELLQAAEREDAGLNPERPVALGISGGRFRIAFMHPDMGRFFGPAWQMPTGAEGASGREQIVLLAQETGDGKIHHLPMHPAFREKVNSVPADDPAMYPSDDVDSIYKYEAFGTHMAEQLLLSLGYFSDSEIRIRKEAGIPLPPHALWVSNSMRRPFSLICNAIASLRTLRDGPAGERIRHHLGRDGFRGLRVLSTGAIPQGGFSSSSALTVAIKNALNVLYGFGIPEDTLVHLACQAEYGTGVRAGSLDQATEQKGKHGQGALISSNPRDNYRTLGIFPVPTEHIHFLFPYTVDRDREAWRWSAGMYAASPDSAAPTPPEIRKLTGKAAELAALLCQLPADQDFFMFMEEDLLRDGLLGPTALTRVYATLRRIPLLISRQDLRSRISGALGRENGADAVGREAAPVDTLFSGWREPRLRRGCLDGSVAEEQGLPLRAIVAYLFVEVARCFRLIREPDRWIGHITRSQRGDCCFEIDPENLPDADTLLSEAEWERGLSGPERLEGWLQRVHATPFDYNRDLDDASLSALPLKPLHEIRGGSFFRGLALLDFAEAMLKRAFGPEAVAVRVNAAGQGDFFQLHLDKRRVKPEQVKRFLDQAFYARFGLEPAHRYVEPHPGGGALGVRLDRFGLLPSLIEALSPKP